ncbi:hypothetical protein [Nocardioides sp. AX2bis]|uniref:hypothetical protein n=1 Tax=Nocardioides sp. AX2bis TaxID=2653157 RepID=UPI00135745ED|nr:hypothetical protein [Nocardioides sp. AX2bis]
MSGADDTFVEAIDDVADMNPGDLERLGNVLLPHPTASTEGSTGESGTPSGPLALGD